MKCLQPTRVIEVDAESVLGISRMTPGGYGACYTPRPVSHSDKPMMGHSHVEPPVVLRAGFRSTRATPGGVAYRRTPNASRNRKHSTVAASGAVFSRRNRFRMLVSEPYVHLSRTRYILRLPRLRETTANVSNCQRANMRVLANDLPDGNALYLRPERRGLRRTLINCLPSPCGRLSPSRTATRTPWPCRSAPWGTPPY